MERYSVLMSVYYKEQPEFLRQSIQSMLDQSIPPDDFVLVEDGSLTPALYSVLATFQREHIDLFQIIALKENQGLGLALRQGLPFCKNEIIARMDSDDISIFNRCEVELALMNQEKADIVSGTILEFHDDIHVVTGRRSLPLTDAEIEKYIRRRNPFNHPAVMFRKSAVIAAGGYQDCHLFEDYHLWVRMLAGGARGANTTEPILHMRTGSGLYARRGGWKYYGILMHFRGYMRKNGYCSLWDYIVTAVGQAMLCLTPEKFRIFLYKIFLR